MSSSSTFTDFLSTVVTYSVVLLSNLLVAVRYFYSNYPDTARFLSMLVAGYIVFKTFMRVLRFWWGMLKFAVKATLLFVIVVASLCAYYRGPHRFFTRDLPFVYEFWQSVGQKQKESIQDSVRYAEILSKTGLDPAMVKKTASGWLAENAEQIDTIKRGAKHLASENMDHVQNFVRSNNLQNLLNLGFGNRGI